MNDAEVLYVTLDEWVHLAAEVLKVDPTTIAQAANTHLAGI